MSERGEPGLHSDHVERPFLEWARWEGPPPTFFSPPQPDQGVVPAEVTEFDLWDGVDDPMHELRSAREIISQAFPAARPHALEEEDNPGEVPRWYTLSNGRRILASEYNGETYEVSNPLTGRPLVIRDFTRKNNKTLYLMVKKAQEERDKGTDERRGSTTSALVDMLVEAFKNGLEPLLPHFGPAQVPPWLYVRAVDTFQQLPEAYDTALGALVVQDNREARERLRTLQIPETPSESSDEEDVLRLEDTFNRIANVYKIDMNNAVRYPPEEGYVANLRRVAEPIKRQLREIMRDPTARSITVYVNYRCEIYVSPWGPADPSYELEVQERYQNRLRAAELKRDELQADVDATGGQDEEAEERLQRFYDDEYDPLMREIRRETYEQTSPDYRATRIGEFSSADYQSHTSGIHVIRTENQVDEIVEAMLATVANNVENTEAQGSSGGFSRSLDLKLHVAAYVPSNPQSLAGHAGGCYLPLPTWAAKGRVAEKVWNPNFYGDREPMADEPDLCCFAWACVYNRRTGRHFEHPPIHPGGNVTHAMLQKLRTILLPEGVDYPIPLDERVFEKIEDLNVLRPKNQGGPFTFSVIEIGSTSGELRLLYESKYRWLRYQSSGGSSDKRHLVIGVVREHYLPPDRQQVRFHFVRILNLSALKGFKNRSHHSSNVCERCFTAHRPENMLDHIRLCKDFRPTEVVMPTPGGKDHVHRFKNWQYLCPAPVVIYADFESYLAPADDEHAPSTVTRTVDWTEEHMMDDGTTYPTFPSDVARSDASEMIVEDDPNPNATYVEDTYTPRRVVHTHEPSGYAYKICCRYEAHARLKGYNGMPLHQVRHFVGPMAVALFYESLQTDCDVIEKAVNAPPLPYRRTSESQRAYEAANDCHICGGMLTLLHPNGPKVLDHDHYTGLYRGAAHRACNVRYTEKNRIFTVPVYFHNMRGYDGKHLLRYVESHLPKIKRMDCIARQGISKYTVITVNNMRFLDSLECLEQSLDNIVAIARKDYAAMPSADDRFEAARRVFGPVFDHFEPVYGTEWMREHFEDILFKKGVYPYTFMTDDSAMDHTMLPEKAFFASELGGYTSCKDEDYARAHRAWRAFGCRDMRDYTRQYVILDVLLLASCVEKYRATCMNGRFRLDPAHFPTAPSLSWQALLLQNYMEDPSFCVENMTDSDQLLMIEKDVRGGVCQVMNPEDTAVNVVCEDPEIGPVIRRSPILYIDANNLYGWGMSQPLPYGNYVWEKSWDATKPQDPRWEETAFNTMRRIAEEILSLPELGPQGWWFEVTLRYPSELHINHCDFPLAPQNRVPEPSEYTADVLERLGFSRSKTGRKLICDFTDKVEYGCHFRLLQFYLRMGLELVCVHRVLRFDQKPWIASYIDYNTERRKVATSDMEKEECKKKNNSAFGKLCERVRDRVNVKFCFAEMLNEALYHLGCGHARQWKPLVPDRLLVIEKSKTKVTMNRPVIAGASILELSKLHMYRSWYTFKRTFGDRIRLNYIDTDCFVFRVTPMRYGSMDVWDELRELRDTLNIFDLSDVADPSHPLLQPGPAGPFDKRRNAKVIGLFKPEMNGAHIRHFVALRAKMYSFEMEATDGEGVHVTHHKKKGIPRGIQFTHAQFMEAFRLGILQARVAFNRIAHKTDNRSFMQLVTVHEEKRSLCAGDDKSYYFDANTVYRYGDFRIREEIGDRAHAEALLMLDMLTRPPAPEFEEETPATPPPELDWRDFVDWGPIDDAPLTFLNDPV